MTPQPLNRCRQGRPTLLHDFSPLGPWWPLVPRVPDSLLSAVHESRRDRGLWPVSENVMHNEYHEITEYHEF